MRDQLVYIPGKPHLYDSNDVGATCGHCTFFGGRAGAFSRPLPNMLKNENAVFLLTLSSAA
jgi:hypothetical protein